MRSRLADAAFRPTSAHLTARQAEILWFIVAHVARTGASPTLREIGMAFGIRSTNGINDALVAIARKGYLIRERTGVARGLRVLRLPDGSSPACPHCGQTMPSRGATPEEAFR